ncbi:phosphopantetheine-binding protein (plasmid) [Burkholderia sp. FERM BP-3421]|uniref:acyl carrier protein n=1 Tax=Burkholderia sp. FERM BP-3421 TaxID=1494466 RepID=UPI002361AAED|nr:acyl carrier protein [Burkholderia sp. FERM BP-3421]WDD90202.1 phosphopantetheine-binding protein [Burkholderia sp. FERM BP-3421]
MASELDAGALRRLRAQGQFLLRPASGMAALARGLCAPAPQVAVIAADWSRVEQARRARSSLLADLRRSAAQQPAASTATPTHDMDPRALVDQAVRKVTGTRASTRLDAHLSLRDLGLDSLMAMELRNELCALTGRRLAPTIAFDYPSIDALATHLASLATGLSAAAATAAPPDPAQGETAPPVDLSADELYARLNQEITALEGHLS